jgi:gliding motility-associated-like protein
VGATDYVWRGPDGFTGHGISTARTNFQSIDAGKYSLEVMIGTCVTQRADIIVDILDVPGLKVISSGSDLLCQGQTKSLSVYPSVSGFNYQWVESSAGNISGATSSTYSASTSGNYFVKLTSIASPSCPAIQSPIKTVKIVQIPVVNFTLPATACLGQVVSFTDQSTLNPDTTGLSVRYAWDFGDNSTSTSVNPTHTFNAVQTFSVKLTVSYLNQSCPASATNSILIQSAPLLLISNPSALYTFCPLDSLQLQATAGFDTYTWSNGGKTQSTYIKAAGTISVDATLGSCKVTASKITSQFPAPTVTATASPTTVKEGTSTQLTATGLANYLWQPGKTLSDSLISNPKATPIQNITYKVSGKDINGCVGQATVDVSVSKDNAVNSLVPSDFFSPNGDTINDTWQVDNAPSQNQCGVMVFDERGFKVFESKPYLNNWNGVSSKGGVLPAGVYFYVLKCDDSPGDFKAGSINIIR